MMKHETDDKNNMEIIEKVKDLKESYQQVKKLQDGCNSQEDCSYCNYLHIIGIKEQPENETSEQTTVQLFKMLEERLQLLNSQLKRAHRMANTQTLHSIPHSLFYMTLWP